MCGILGFVSGEPGRGERARNVLGTMMTALAHRGPDADGSWCDTTGRVNLGHRRLAIIDLSPGGAQPMRTPDGRGVIVYNGELYNFRALRAELEGQGVTFASRSDTEVLLSALYHWGPECALPKFNGMFAFAYWDGRCNELVLARDRFGEKPLYYSQQNGALYFGSELKALRAHPDYEARIDKAVLPHYFRLNYIPAPHTIYEDTWKLPAGHWTRYHLDTGRLEAPQAYWTLSGMAESVHGQSSSSPINEITDEAETVLRRAVEMRLISDRPVGCFLSGGIDSSTVAALMQSVSSERIQTFTIGYGERNLNEAEDAERVARHLGTAHTTLIVQAQEALSMIPAMPDVYDEPFADASQIPTCLLSQLTSRHVTVALSGDGGDEVFGGYNRYIWAREVWTRLQALPSGMRTLLMGGVHGISPRAWDSVNGLMGSVLPRRMRIRSAGDKLHKIAFLAQAKDEQELYCRLVSVSHDLEGLCLQSGIPASPFERMNPPPALRSIEERMMYWDSLTYLPDDILVKVDRAAMHFGLEGRIPFLDNAVLEFAWRLPLERKIKGRKGKRIVREVLNRHVPAEMFDRPKTGFGIPINDWLRGPLREWAEDLLAAPVLQEYIRMEPVRELWRQHQSRQRNTDHQLWSVLMFSAWLQRWHGQGAARVPASIPVVADGMLKPRAKREVCKGKVVFLLNSLVSGGAEKQLLLTAAALAKSNYRAEIFTLRPTGQGSRLDSLVRSAQHLGVQIFTPNSRRGWLLHSLNACRRSLRQGGKCVLWTWGSRSDLAATMFLREGAPRISSLRDANAGIIRQRAGWWRFFDSGCARYVSNTWLNVEQLASIIPSVRERSRVLYNALEPEALIQPFIILPEQPTCLEIVMLGNLFLHKKGYDLAVELMHRLQTEGRPIRLRIAGLPIEKERLTSLIAAAGVAETLQYVGPVSEPLEFLRSGHLFLLLSRFEGMPNALLEAMSLGLPCISTKVGDVARLTVDGKHLRQIEVEDVEGACRAVRDAQDSWEAFRAMGMEGRALIQREFSAEAFETSVEDCVGDLLTAEPKIQTAELRETGQV